MIEIPILLVVFCTVLFTFSPITTISFFIYSNKLKKLNRTLFGYLAEKDRYIDNLKDLLSEDFIKEYKHE
jgi:hypothetical protein